jgi:threonine/homoserine/homoserine lactone efflux protein
MDLPSITFAAMLGFALGFFGSVPTVGPIGMLVVSRGLMGRPRSSRHIALGAALAEAGYAALAYWGFTKVMARFPHLVSTSRVVACGLLVGIGLYFALRGASPRATQAEDRGGPRSALLGWTMTAFNPTLLVTWGAAVGIAHSTGLAPPTSWAALPFALGAGAGILAWFEVLVRLVARVRMTPPTLNVVVRAAGGVLLVCGAVAGVHLFLTRF